MLNQWQVFCSGAFFGIMGMRPEDSNTFSRKILTVLTEKAWWSDCRLDLFGGSTPSAQVDYELLMDGTVALWRREKGIP